MSPITHAKVANKAETSLQLSETESQWDKGSPRLIFKVQKSRMK